MTNTTFRSLGIDEKFCRALDEIGYLAPTPIQAQAIPDLLNGTDLLGIAQTGTGKTAAFALPLMHFLDEETSPADPKRPLALILAPTRELALQIDGELTAFGRHASLAHTFIIGGVGYNPQITALAKGVDILVATPGRLLDLIGNGHVDLGDVSVLILDEADRLLDMGFIRDIRRIVALIPEERQTLLFSATMPKEVARLANEILWKPVHVDVSPKEKTLKEIEQRTIEVDNGNKLSVLTHLLQSNEVTRAIVFTRTKHGANKVARKLLAEGILAEAIHGNKSQGARQRAMQGFRDGETWVLVATDIAARGIDIEGITHIFNYELPHEPECYVHRIGRTGRAGATGVAWSLVDPSERPRLKAIERLIGFSPRIKRVDVPVTVTAQNAPAQPRHKSSHRAPQRHTRSRAA